MMTDQRRHKNRNINEWFKDRTVKLQPDERAWQGLDLLKIIADNNCLSKIAI